MPIIHHQHCLAPDDIKSPLVIEMLSPVPFTSSYLIHTQPGNICVNSHPQCGFEKKTATGMKHKRPLDFRCDLTTPLCTFDRCWCSTQAGLWLITEIAGSKRLWVNCQLPIRFVQPQRNLVCRAKSIVGLPPRRTSFRIISSKGV